MVVHNVRIEQKSPHPSPPKIDLNMTPMLTALLVILITVVLFVPSLTVSIKKGKRYLVFIHLFIFFSTIQSPGRGMHVT